MVRAWLAALTVLAAPLGAHAALPSIAVLQFPAKVGIDQERIDLFSELLQNELRGRGYKVIGQADIQALLDLEAQKQVLACDEASCLAEISGALGVDEIVHGSVAKMGPYLLINVKRTSRQEARVLAQAVRKLEGAGDKELVDAVGPIVDELYGPVVHSAPPALQASARSSQHTLPRALPWALWGIGGVAFFVGAVFEVRAIGQANHANDPSYVGGQLEAERAPTSERIAWASGLAGVGLIAGGTLVHLFSAPTASVEVALTPRPGGLDATVAGRF